MDEYHNEVYYFNKHNFKNYCNIVIVIVIVINKLKNDYFFCVSGRIYYHSINSQFGTFEFWYL